MERAHDCDLEWFETTSSLQHSRFLAINFFQKIAAAKRAVSFDKNLQAAWSMSVPRKGSTDARFMGLVKLFGWGQGEYEKLT
jgi:hypothetical protein